MRSATAGMAETAGLLEAWIDGQSRKLAAEPAARAALDHAWEEACRDNEDDKSRFRTFVQALRQNGYGASVPALARDFALASPGAPWPWIIAAEAAEAEGDQEEFARLAGEVRSRFPGMQGGHRLTVEAAIAAGRLDEAASRLGSVPSGHANEDWVLRARIALAERHDDHPAALQAGLALAARKPKRLEGPLAIAGALNRLGRLDEAEQRVAALLPLHPQSGAVAQAAAEIAEARGDHETALARWAEMRRRARGTPAPYLGTLRCLRATRRLDLAMPVLHEALARFPDDEELLVAAARIAEGAAQAEDADLYWQRVLRIHPGDAGHALSAALCLVGSPAGRPARMPEVLRRLAAHHAAFPDYQEAYAAHITALRTARKPGLAVAISAPWRVAFPDDAAIALARAGAFEDLGDRNAALEEVVALRARIGPHAEIDLAHVRALSVAGRPDDADAACRAALSRHPQHLRLLLERARIATRSGDWNEAQSRLLEAQKTLPGNEKIGHELQLLRQQMVEAEPPDAQAPASTVLAQFESLGGTGVSCEFAMIQRQRGADRIGLLRWSRNEVSHLLDALGAAFEGVGSEEATILKTARHGPDNEEYVTQDRRYFMESHTFVQTSDAPFESMFRQTCRRLRFLREKMLEELRAAERIFVFKAHRPVSDDEARDLHAALRVYGDNALLCVARADAGHPRGSLRELEFGLYAGYVGHFLNDDSGNAGSDIPAWENVCGQAVELWRQAASRAAVPALA